MAASYQQHKAEACTSSAGCSSPVVRSLPLISQLIFWRVVCGTAAARTVNYSSHYAQPSKLYIGHGRLSVCLFVCVSVPRRMPTLLRGPRCSFEEW